MCYVCGYAGFTTGPNKLIKINNNNKIQKQIVYVLNKIHILLFVYFRAADDHRKIALRDKILHFAHSSSSQLTLLYEVWLLNKETDFVIRF